MEKASTFQSDDLHDDLHPRDHVNDSDLLRTRIFYQGVRIVTRHLPASR